MSWICGLNSQLYNFFPVLGTLTFTYLGLLCTFMFANNTVPFVVYIKACCSQNILYGDYIPLFPTASFTYLSGLNSQLFNTVFYSVIKRSKSHICARISLYTYSLSLSLSLSLSIYLSIYLSRTHARTHAHTHLTPMRTFLAVHLLSLAIPQATVPPSTMAASTTTVTVAATTSATRTTRTTSTVSPNGVPVAFPDLSVNVVCLYHKTTLHTPRALVCL